LDPARGAGGSVAARSDCCWDCGPRWPPAPSRSRPTNALAALPAAPILRVATVPEPRDERPDAEAERARRAALELPPRLVLER
jgi:hypothetical protein